MTKVYQRALGAAAIAILAAGTLAGCNKGPAPSVQDFDSYRVINIGALRYVTPEEITVSGTKPSTVHHDVASLPGARVKVRYDSNPPRSLKFDADAEKRRFLDEIPAGRLTSVQYFAPKDREQVKIIIRGQDRQGAEYYGVLVVVREDQKTAVVSAVGPWDLRDRMDVVVEDLSNRLDLGSGSRAIGG